MAGRIVAVALLVVVLGIVSAFVAGLLFGPASRSDVATTSIDLQRPGSRITPLEFDRRLGDWTVRGLLEIDQTGSFQMTMRFDSPGTGALVPAFVPTVRLEMPGHPMSGTLAHVESAGSGTYRARGALTMEGRWQFQIALPSEEATEILVDFNSAR